MTKEYSHAKQVIEKYTAAELQKEHCPLHCAYGCLLYLTKSPESAMIHFSTIKESPFPPTTSLASHFLVGRIDEDGSWFEHSFYWEKVELFRRLVLFFGAIQDKAKYKYFINKLKS